MKQSKLMRKSAGSEAGFTLIELMIVVAIIGILAAIAIPNFLRAMNQAKYTNCVESLSGIKVAEEMYLTDNGVYVPTGTTATGMARLAMYMIPGCTLENDVGATCGGALWTRMLRNCTAVRLYSPAARFDYEIMGSAKDRYTTPICMNPRGYLPASYKTVNSTTAIACP